MELSLSSKYESESVCLLESYDDTEGERATRRNRVPSSAVLGVTERDGYESLAEDPPESDRGAGVVEGDSDVKVAVPYSGERRPADAGSWSLRSESVVKDMYQ